MASERIEASREEARRMFVDMGADDGQLLHWAMVGYESRNAEVAAIREDAEANVSAAVDAFKDLLEGAEDMRPYVSDYFAEKWGHDGYLERARAALAKFKEAAREQ